MKEGRTHYVSSSGIYDVREAIRDKAKKHNGIRAEVKNTIFITTKLSVYAPVMAATQGGGQVLIPNPGYFYQQPVTLAGAVPVRYRLADDFSLDLAAIERVVTKKVRTIIVNTPSNPTGKVRGKGELKELLEFCTERGIKAISDESYEDLMYSKKNVSLGSLEPQPETVVSLFSLSKSFAMKSYG